jgi:hypothetical protein
MQWLGERIKLLVPLLAAVYLGFYVYGLVMTVFTPFEFVLGTVIAIVCALGIVAFTVAGHFGIHPVPADSPLARSARAEKEHRGF